MANGNGGSPDTSTQGNASWGMPSGDGAAKRQALVANIRKAYQPMRKAQEARIQQTREGVQASQADLSSRADQAQSTAQQNIRALGSMKRGGVVRKTGLWRLHKGERVIPAHKVARGRGR